MKKINIIMGILFIVFCLVCQGIALEKVKPDGELAVKPEVKIDQPVFTFESVPEGIHVSHEFVIKNTGNALLRIEKVLPP